MGADEDVLGDEAPVLARGEEKFIIHELQAVLMETRWCQAR